MNKASLLGINDRWGPLTEVVPTGMQKPCEKVSMQSEHGDYVDTVLMSVLT